MKVTSSSKAVETITNKIKTADLNWLNSFDYLFIAGGVNDCQLGVSESDFKNAITDSIPSRLVERSKFSKSSFF